jgi:aminoglycoside 6'-N-acetyltransferase I
MTDLSWKRTVPSRTVRLSRRCLLGAAGPEFHSPSAWAGELQSLDVMIRECTSPEHPGWLELRLVMWPEDDRAAHIAEMTKFCAEPRRFGQFIAYSEQSEARGLLEVALRSDYVNGTESSPIAFLEGIYVASEFRRQGIARALVRAAEQWARSRGCAEFASDVLIDNRASYAMHRALGFEETERVIFFRKLLSPR